MASKRQVRTGGWLGNWRVEPVGSKGWQVVNHKGEVVGTFGYMYPALQSVPIRNGQAVED